MATWYVNTHSSNTAGGDGTTNNITGSTRAFASLNEAEATNKTVTNDIIECDSGDGTADSTSVDWNGWSITGNLTVRANRGETTGFYDGDLVWSNSHYRLVGFNSNQLQIQDPDIIIDGLQIQSTHTSTNRYSISIAENNTTIRNCRVTRGGLGGGGHCINFNNGTFRSGGDIENCIIFDTSSDGDGVSFGASGSAARTQRVFNCVIFDVDYGINYKTDDVDLTYEFRNNVIFNVGASDRHWNPTDPTNASWTHTHQAVDLASTSETGGQALGTGVLTDDMVDPENGTMLSRNVRGVSGGQLESNATSTNIPANDFYGTARSSPYDMGIDVIEAGGTTHDEAVAETISFADTSTETAGFAATAAETLTLTDPTSELADFVETVAEALALADAGDTAGSTFVRVLSETLNLADASTKSLEGDFQKFVAESLSLTDATTETAGFARGVAETLTFTDLVARTATLLRTLTETLLLSDASTADGGIVEVTTTGGASMTLKKMRELERQQLLAMLRHDDEIVLALLAEVMKRGRRN